MNDLLTVAEAAARRGCSTGAIYAAIDDGRLPAYDSPGGVRHVWRDDVDAMEAPRQVNTPSGEPVLAVADVPGDDDAVRKGLEEREIRFIYFCISYTCAHARLHISQRPISQRLLRRFLRLTTTKEQTT